MGKMTKKGKKGAKATVQVIADGTNRVTLVFPKTAKVKGKRKLSADEVLKLLFGVSKSEVAGQDCLVNHCPQDY
jgi:hypothetical protein